ncbi:MAG: TIGR02647 family protein [Oleiphilus sp.]
MPIPSDLTDEMRVLAMFDLSTTQQGIKVHHDADETLIAATQRLFNKGLISQSDGGYLTGLGRDAALHVSDLMTILTTS